MNIFNIFTGKDHVNKNRFPSLKFISGTKITSCVIIFHHFQAKIKEGGDILRNMTQPSKQFCD